MNTPLERLTLIDIRMRDIAIHNGYVMLHITALDRAPLNTQFEHPANGEKYIFRQRGSGVVATHESMQTLMRQYGGRAVPREHHVNTTRMEP